MWLLLPVFVETNEKYKDKLTLGANDLEMFEKRYFSNVSNDNHVYNSKWKIVNRRILKKFSCQKWTHADWLGQFEEVKAQKTARRAYNNHLFIINIWQEYRPQRIASGSKTL